MIVIGDNMAEDINRLKMAKDNTNTHVSIPAVLISKDDGDEIKK